MFHALTKEQIRDIVLLQLERVRRVAKGQGVTLAFDPSLVDHLTEAGYQPEFGARELKRRIRAEVENALANALLRGEVAEGDNIRARYDPDGSLTRFDKIAASPPVGTENDRSSDEDTR